MKKWILTMAAAAALASGQVIPGPPGGPGTPGGPIRQQPLGELRAHLGLTDQQVDQLRNLQREKFERMRSTQEQIAERQRTLQQTLRDPNANPTALGQILLDTRNLQTQARQIEGQYHNLALAVLTADQRPKLRALEDAVRLQPAINQAYQFDLLERPEGRPLPLPMPVFQRSQGRIQLP